MRVRTMVAWSAGLVLAAPCSRAGDAEAPSCSNPQSPRSIDRKVVPSPYAGTSQTSIVTQAHDDTLEYTPRAGGLPTTLTRCGQHYHLPIEDPQGCPGEITPGPRPRPGNWIEVHTVYAARVRRDGCDPETLACCETGPFLVRAFSARVTTEGPDDPIVPPPGRPLAEWSGSTTGPGGQCKPAAQWSFRLGCDFTVSTTQLSRFKHADPARDVQPPPLLSKDLTLVVP